MEITFTNKKLEKLYETGSSNKYKLEKAVITSFFEVVAILESSKDIYDLWKLPSLKFEKLQGHENKYSARLTQKWRLEMFINWTNEIKSIGIIGIEDISNHYGGSYG